MLNTKKEVAYIIGGTSGIGMETAKLLLKQGTSVCITGRNPKHIEASQYELSKLGELEIYKCDLYEFEDVYKTSTTLAVSRQLTWPVFSI